MDCVTHPLKNWGQCKVERKMRFEGQVSHPEAGKYRKCFGSVRKKGRKKRYGAANEYIYQSKE